MDAGFAAIVGTGWASGINLYGTVLLLGIFGRMDLAPVPEVLTSWPVIIVAATLYLIEMVADKIPWLDSGWDVVHTAIRPIGAAVLGAVLAGEADISALLSAGTSGGMAFASHATKASTRVAINASPEPVSNVVVSLFEDGLVAVMMWLVVEQPVLAAILAVVFLIAGATLVFFLWRLVRSGWKRLRGGRPPTAGGPPTVRPPDPPPVQRVGSQGPT